MKNYTIHFIDAAGQQVYHSTVQAESKSEATTKIRYNASILKCTSDIQKYDVVTRNGRRPKMVVTEEVNFENTSELIADLKNSPNFPKDTHQALLDIQYDKWTSGKFDGYTDMIVQTQKQYGDLHAFAIVVGKYNQQVGNGGHIQYYDNGYASEGTEGCFANHHGDISFHKDYVVDLLERCDDLKSYPWYKELLSIATAFEPLIDEEQYSEEEYYDEDEGTWSTEECENPDYGMVYNQHDLDQLDDRFYKISNQMMKDLNQYFSNKLS